MNVGENDGIKLGSFDGTIVGVVLGKAVLGTNVGENDGDIEGNAVGDKVVGATVGSIDGLATGALVGCAFILRMVTTSIT